MTVLKTVPITDREPGDAEAPEALSRVMAHALSVFGEQRNADIFMTHPNPALGGCIPVELARTEEGAHAVDVVLGRIEHGIFS